MSIFYSTCSNFVEQFCSTSLEPLRWTRLEITYDTIGGEQYPVTRYYYHGEQLMFTHTLAYDTEGNLTSILVE